MATFREPQVVHLPPEAVARATAFADAVIETVNYRDSNQSVKEKIRDDHFVSKLGEEAVRFVFEKRDCVVEGPDYTIYSGKGKSWDADLKINDLEVAVKTQRRSAAKDMVSHGHFRIPPNAATRSLICRMRGYVWWCLRI